MVNWTKLNSPWLKSQFSSLKARKVVKRKISKAFCFLTNKDSLDSEYITSVESLNALCKKIKDGDIITIDTEFIRRTTYYPILCLIQVGHNGKIYLIDCVNKLDISAILDVINNPKIKKILHAASQDLEIFYQESGAYPANIEDTQILANFTNFDFNSSYARLTKSICRVELDKQMQNSNWLKRPLSASQIEYAKIDVVYLEKIYTKLKKKVEKKGLLDHYYQDMEASIKSLSTSNPAPLFKVFAKGRRKNLKNNKVPKGKVMDLLIWRDKMAAKIDVPRRRLISDDDLEALIIGKKVNLRLGDKLKKSLDELLKKRNYNLDFNAQSYNINYDKKEFALVRDELVKMLKKSGIDERFVVSSTDLQAIFYHGNNYDNLTQWRRDIISELKTKFGYEK